MRTTLLILVLVMIFSTNLFGQTNSRITTKKSQTEQNEQIMQERTAGIGLSLEAQAHSLGITKNDIIPSEKDPALAFLYGLIAPGLGQIYNERVKSGIWIFTGTGILFGISLRVAEKNNKKEIVYLAPVVWLISAMVAPFTSEKINREVRIKRAIRDRLLRGESTSLLDNIEIQPYYDGRTAGLNLSYSW
jgi:hypothetical protein